MSGLSDPLQCRPEEKAEREAANTVAQLDYITDLVVRRRLRAVRESHVRELHELAIQGIYPCGGRYRDARFTLKISDGKHEPPPAAMVPGLMVDLVEACNAEGTHALARSAYALWRFNWIHPFAGGNGRTARAISYLILCMDFGGMLRGVPSIPGLIAQNRDGYLKALRDTDALFAAFAARDPSARERTVALLPMQAFVGEMFLKQIFSASPSASRIIRLFFSFARFLGA